MRDGRHESRIRRSARLCNQGESSHVKDAVNRWRILVLQDAERHVIYRNTAGGAAFGSSVMGVAMENEGGAVAVDNFSQSRTAQVGKNLRRLAAHRVNNWGVVHHDDTLVCAHLR